MQKDGRNRTGINLNEDIAQQIRVLAEQEKRTLTAEVHVLLDFALAQWGSNKGVTPEWIEERFDAMGQERVKRLVLSGIEYLISGGASTEENQQLAVSFLRKLVDQTATDGDAIEVADALDLDTASLSKLVRFTKGGKKTSNGV